jgi:malate dehydrogenase (oxaloacetate-decarboxylating)(NADP+)
MIIEEDGGTAMSEEKGEELAQIRATQLPIGLKLLREPSLNKGTVFTEEERKALGLRGLLPPHVHSLQEQVMRVMEQFNKKPTDAEKYIYMMALQTRNETLFYRVILDNIEEMMPIIYTPTVGEACQKYGHIFRTPRGIFISARDRGRVIDILRNWPNEDVHTIVVTDGERILGLGDLGANGMGIPVGKLCLYTACAGIHPALCLPVTLDVGTDNDRLRDDPLYIGLRQQRLKGEAYDYLLEEFVMAVQELYPHTLIQFEDFANKNAFRLLKKFKEHVCTFNDDIQGTGAVALAGLYSAMRITGGKLEDQKILFLGAGEAGIGIGNMVVCAMVDEGLSEQEARNRCWFFDIKGLIVKDRNDLDENQLVYAHTHEHIDDFLSTVQSLRPTAIVGVAGQPKTFTQPVLETMASYNERPIIFAMSNPTSKSECNAEEAYSWTEGRAIFASGSPFDPIMFDGKTYMSSQANNVYIFPGIGLGVTACSVRFVTDEMFLAAAKALAREVSAADLKQGLIYPSLTKIRDVSTKVATAVAEVAYNHRLASKSKPTNLLTYIKSQMYEPNYYNYV